MAMLSSRIRGLDRLKARLAGTAATGRATAGEALSRLAETAAAEVRATLDVPPDAVTVASRDGGAIVTLDLPFARALEFGTARRPARPVLRPAAERAARDTASLAAAVAAALTASPR